MTTHLVPIYQNRLPMYYMDHLSTIAVIQGTSSLVPVPVSVILEESLEHLCQTVSVSFNLLLVPSILKVYGIMFILPPICLVALI